jgi:hypothetical protein
MKFFTQNIFDHTDPPPPKVWLRMWEGRRKVNIAFNWHFLTHLLENMKKYITSSYLINPSERKTCFHLHVKIDLHFNFFLKRYRHDMRRGLQWYGLIDLDQERSTIFSLFSNCPFNIIPNYWTRSRLTPKVFEFTESSLGLWVFAICNILF